MLEIKGAVHLLLLCLFWSFVFKLSIMPQCYRCAVLDQWAVAPFLPTTQHSHWVTSPEAIYQITCSGLLMWRIGLRWVRSGQDALASRFFVTHLYTVHASCCSILCTLRFFDPKASTQFFIKRYPLHSAEKTASTFKHQVANHFKSNPRTGNAATSPLREE